MSKYETYAGKRQGKLLPIYPRLLGALPELRDILFCSGGL